REDRVVVELGREALFGQFHPIAFDARETNLQRVALGPDRLDLDRFARRLRRGDDRLGGEVERNAEHVGVLDVEKVFFVELIRLAAQSAADDLFAQKLRAESANA